MLFLIKFCPFLQSWKNNVKLMKMHICLVVRLEVLRLYFIKIQIYKFTNSKPKGISGILEAFFFLFYLTTERCKNILKNYIYLHPD